jgi:peptidoglycan/LPS O-acetylase OafA/YrhL
MQATARLPGIDVLRGLAALGVVLHHIHLRFSINKYPVAELLPRDVGRVLFWSGYYAVIVFFVISGFLIASLALQRWGTLQRIDLKQFYVLRAARILPCLLLLLAVLAVLHGLAVPGFVVDPQKASLLRALVAALTFHFNWLEGHVGYLPGNWDVLWSLSNEEAFYLLFPILCVLARSGWVLVFAATALIVAGPCNRVALAEMRPWDDYAYLSCMDGLAFGCIAAWLRARVSFGKTQLRSALFVGVVLVLLIVVFRRQAAQLHLPQTGLNVTALELGMALILLAIANDAGNRFLSRGTQWLQAVGRASYEIYLTHMFVVLGAMPRFFLWYVGLLLASATFGLLVHRYYSEPVNRALRQRFAPLTTAATLPESAIGSVR